jgi:hypothetical protein
MVFLPMIFALWAGRGLIAAEPPAPGGDAVNHAAAQPNQPIYVILKSPSDINGILKGIPPGSKIVEASQSDETPVNPNPKDPNRSWSHVVRSVKITGQLVDERADLTVEMEIELREDGPLWVPIRLDNRPLFAIREAGRDILHRCLPQNRNQWEVRLDRKGVHRIRVELKVFLRSILDRSVLDLDIPNAATTLLEFDVPQRVADATAGLNEPVGQVSLGPGKGYRLVAHLPPRAKLDLSWRKETGTDAERQPLISVQGEIALDAELESLRTRSSWLVRCVRGSAQSLEIALDNQDEVLEVFLDDQVIRFETERVGRVTQLKIPLAQPMTPGSTRRLVFKTRRASAAGASSTTSFKGFAFSHAKDQSGAVALFPGVNLWANFVLGQSVLQINPAEMPADLRARPGMPLAFQFLDQPFELKLSIEPSPPLASTETRTVFRFGPDVVNQVTWIDLQRVRGRLFDVEIGIPGDLELTACGPQELIEPANQSDRAAVEKLVGDANQTRILKIRLSAQAMEQKKITIRLEGHQRYRPTASTRLELFQPRNTIEIASRFAVFGSRDLTIESKNGGTPSESRIEQRFNSEEDAGDWPWPGVAAGTGRPSLILRAQGLPKFLPLDVSRNPRAISQEVTLSARLTHRAVDVQQRSVCEVRNGTAGTIELLVPAQIDDDWSVVGLESKAAEQIERASDGERRYRIHLPEPSADRFTLRFRYRIKFRAELDSKTQQSSSIPWIGVVDATPRDVRLNLSADPGIHLESTNPQWSIADEDQLSDPAGSSQTVASTYRLDQPTALDAAFRLNAWAGDRAGLPKTVCPEAFIQTSVGFDSRLHTKAWFSIENHAPELIFAPPPSTRLIRVRIDGHIIDPDEVELDGSGRGFRVSLPVDRDDKLVLLEMEYESAIESARGDWSAPRLLGDASVLATYWEVVLPWNLALVGSPTGWSDDNQWYWENYIWKRRPTKSISARIDRLGANASGEGRGEEVGSDSHKYLFSHAGEGSSIQVRIVSRSWLVLVCSGVVLLTGIALILLPRPKARLVLGLITTVGLIAGALLRPSTLIVAGQSSVIGIVLTLMGFVIQHLIESRRPAIGYERDSAIGAAAFAPGSTRTRPPEVRPSEVGSDESTAIRVRVASTMEYRSQGTSPEEPEPAPESKIELVR